MPHFLLIPALLAGALLLTSLAFWQGLYGGFMFDDFPNIVSNPTIHIQQLSLISISDALSSGGTGVLGRPLSMISFAINHALSGMEPFIFKAVNLAIHLINGLLIFWLTRTLFAISAPAASWTLPVWVTAAWLLHPINLTPVLHVVQRMTELSALFTLAGLLLYLRLRTTPPSSVTLWGTGWLGVALLWLLGFLSKESAVLAPLFALLIEIYVLRNESPGNKPCVLCRFAGMTVFALLVAAVISHLGIGAFSPGAFLYRDFSMAERAMTELRVLWLYVQLILLPTPSAFGLFHDDLAISRSWLAPWTTLVAASAWLVVLAGLFKYGRRAPLIGFGIAWFLVGHLLESSILALELVHEHRNYLPVFGLLLATAEAGRLYVLPRLGKLRLLTLLFVLVPLAVLLFNTSLRAYAFGDPVRLAKIEAANHPQSSRAQYEAGRVLAESAGGWLIMQPEAREEIQVLFNTAILLDPNTKQPLISALMFACMYGDTAQPAWTEELRKRWEFGRFGVADRSAVSDMAKYGMSGRLCLDADKLNQQFEALLANNKLAPYDRAMAFALLGNIAQAMNQAPEAARQHYRKALDILPASVIRLRYAQLLFAQKDYSGAEKELNAISPHEFSEDWQPAAARELQASLAAIKHTTREHSPQTSRRP